MYKQIVDIDKKKGIAQITTYDERVYTFPQKDKKTGLPSYIFKPSVTYINSVGYPKSKWFMDWLKKNGEEAEQIKMAARDRGSKIHQAIEKMLTSDEHSVAMDDMFINSTTKKEEPLEPDEYYAVKCFIRWYETVVDKDVEVLGVELTVDSDKHNYAGTLDFLVRIENQVWLIDFKTGQSIYEEYKLQTSALRQCVIEKNVCEVGDKDIKMAILQLGYKRNKDGYKFTEITDDKFDMFLSAKAIFHNEVANLPYRQIELPLKLTLPIKKQQNEEPIISERK